MEKQKHSKPREKFFKVAAAIIVTTPLSVQKMPQI